MVRLSGASSNHQDHSRTLDEASDIDTLFATLDEWERHLSQLENLSETLDEAAEAEVQP